MIDKRPFGENGFHVGEISLGTWAMGGGIYGDVTDEESLRAIRRAGQLGVNLIDTAPIYGMGQGVDGHAEQLAGRAIAGERDRWLVSTKWGRNLDFERYGAGDPSKTVQDFSYDRALRSVEESLDRLAIDYVDLYFVHTPLPNSLFDPRSLDAMDELKDEGTIHCRGFSLGTVEDDVALIEPFIRDGRLDCVQVTLNLLQQAAKERLLDLCAQFGLGVLARETLARGFLADAFGADTAFPSSDFRSALGRGEIERRLAGAERYRFLTADGRSLPQAAVSWVLSHSPVSSVVAGPRTVAELEQLAAAAVLPRFDRETMARTEAVYAEQLAEGWALSVTVKN